VADGFITVPMNLNDFERRDERGQIFKRISLITVVPFGLERYMPVYASTRQDNTWREVISRGTHAPTASGRCRSAPQFWRSLSIYAHKVCRGTTKDDVVDGDGIVFKGSAAPPPQGSEASTLPNCGVPFCLCVHHLPQNRAAKSDVHCMLTHMGRRLVCRDQPRPNPTGRGPSGVLPSGSFLFMCIPFIASKFDVVTYGEWGLFLGVSYASTRRRQATVLLIFGVPFYL